MLCPTRPDPNHAAPQPEHAPSAGRHPRRATPTTRLPSPNTLRRRVDTPAERPQPRGSPARTRSVGGSTPSFFDPLLELGFQLVENASGEAIDSASARADRGAGTTDLAHHREGTKAGKESQESLQKAAEHMQEIIKIEQQLQESGGVEPNDCEALLERLRVFYKIDHHLDRVEAYLGEAVDQIDVLAGALGDKMDRFVPAHNRIWELTGEIIGRGDHSNCQGVCYEVGSVPRRVY